MNFTRSCTCHAPLGAASLPQLGVAWLPRHVIYQDERTWLAIGGNYAVWHEGCAAGELAEGCRANTDEDRVWLLYESREWQHS